jgi:hypothetical protein
MNLPFQETWLLDFGIVLLIIVTSYILFFLVQRILDVFRLKDKRKYNKEGCFAFLLKIVILAILLGFCLAFIGFAILVQSFNEFSAHQLIADVTCEKIDNINNTMRFTITLNDGILRHFYIQGDEWFVEGDIIVWKSVFNLFGLSNRYRITKIGGRYKKTADKRFRTQTIHYLNKEEITPRWRWLYNYGKNMPLARSNFGISTSFQPNVNKIFKIYVTPSGFEIEEFDKDLPHD